MGSTPTPTDRGYRIGHADPTATRATHTTAPVPKIIEQLDRNLHAIHAQARNLNHTTANTLGHQRTHFAYEPDRYGLCSNAIAYLPLGHQLDDAANHLHGHDLTRYDWTIQDLDDRAQLLVTRATDILATSPTAAAQPAVQKTITECSSCSPWRKGTIAIQAGRCEQCRDFLKNHGCNPTEPIVRRWDYGKSATPAQIIEAKARAPKRRSRKAS